MRELESLDRGTFAIWDRRLGIVADVTRLGRSRWAVEDYYAGCVAYFRTRAQAIHFAMQLPEQV